MQTLYPQIKPYARHDLAVDAPHVLYVDESGSPEGLPVLFIHGGPGSIKWSVKAGSRLSGGTLATAGGLVFSGEEDGHLDAHDAATGTLLWRFQCGAGIGGPPITYSLDGRQYVAVAAGGASFTKGSGFGTGDALVVFSLPE